MSRTTRILYLALVATVLVGCTVTFDLQPPWRRSLLPPRDHGMLVKATPTPTSSTVTITNTTTSTPSAQAPVHILDIRPLTTTGSFSLTTFVDVNSIHYANGCTVNQALGRAPTSLNDAEVLAAVTYISGTVSVGSGADTRAAFAPTLGRTLYWSSDSGSSIPDCSAPGTWLWQEIALMPDQSAAGGIRPMLLSLPAQSACVFEGGFTPAVFGEMVANMGEWPHLLYMSDVDDQPTLLLLQQDRCGSGSGCAVVRTICQSLFEDGAWREWCTSLCS